MGTRSEEKWELVDFNDRFQTYVQRVRKLKDETDLESFYSSIQTLEDEIKNMNLSHQSEIGKLKYCVEMLTKEKSELERDVIAQKNTEAHLSDRLNVEIEKTNRLMEEVAFLQKTISAKDAEIREVNSALQQAQFNYGTLLKEYDETQMKMEELRRFSESSATAYADSQAKIKILEEKLEFQDKFHEERTVELRQRLEKTQMQMTELECRLQEANKKEREFPEQLHKAQAVAAEEMKQYQFETDKFYKSTFESLNATIDEERLSSRNLQSEIDRLNSKVVAFRTESTELRAKASALEQQKLILEQTLENERHQTNQTINNMERKLKEVQEMMALKLQEASASREAHISLRNELDSLRSLIEQEESRLDISQRHPQPPGSERTHTSNGTLPSQRAVQQEKAVELQPAETSEVQPVTDTLVGEEELLPACGEVKAEEAEENGAADIGFEGLERAIEEAAAEAFQAEEVVEVVQTPRGQSPTPLKQALIGPIVSPRAVIGPIRSVSAPNSGRSVSSLGQSRDYHDAMFHDANSEYQREVEAGSKRVNSAVQHDITNATSSSTGDLKILEVQPQGQYVRVWNSNDHQEVDFGNYSLQQNVAGNPVAVYRFPARTKLAPNSTVTVWAACSQEAGCHRPPTDFFWPELTQFGAGPECTTVLSKPSGEPVAWTTANLRFVKDNFVITAEERNSFHGSNTLLNSEEFDPVLGAEKLPELPANDKNSAVFLKRENRDPSYAVSKHPHGHQTKAQVHPSMGQQAVQLFGNDNSSINRQARSQLTSVPDPVPGEPYAGVSNQRLASARLLRFYPGVLRPSGAVHNRTPDVLLRSCLDTPSPFQPPHTRFDRGMRQIRSVHDTEHCPPLPRRQPLVSEW